VSSALPSLFRFGKDKSFRSGQVKLIRCGDISGMAT
jgi:hypothetical protein